MQRVMPSQAIAAIETLFPSVTNEPSSNLHAGLITKLFGIVTLVEGIPEELLVLSNAEYARLILCISTIKAQIQIWNSKQFAGQMRATPTIEAITTVRGILSTCPDEYPPRSSNELPFIPDVELRGSIARDVGAAYRALNNAEWKAATVLAGATIEALLHWRLQQAPPSQNEVITAVAALKSAGTLPNPLSSDLDKWSLHEFIVVAKHLGLLKPDTVTAVGLAQNFRNLIHPGRAARLGQVCDRGTAYSAIGALEHVIRDLTP